MACTDCCVKNSSQWRKIDKKIYCNACAVHFKRSGFHKDLHYYANILIHISQS